MAATHAGMTTEEFAKTVLDWIATARHPRFNRPYTDLVYQPMLELLAYLRANGFKTFIVSGGGVEFMRPWTEKVYGIPPEQVVGSSGVVEVRDRRGRQAGADQGSRRSSSSTTGPASRSASTASSAAGRSSPSAIPTATCRCCNGPPAATGARFAGIVHHTDAEREYAYDRQSHIGKLDKALDEAMQRRLDRRRHEAGLEGGISGQAVRKIVDEKELAIALALCCLSGGVTAQAASPDDRLSAAARSRPSIWGMPAVNYDLMLQEMLTKTPGKVNQVIYWGKPLDWQNQTLTPNPDTLYFMAFFNTKDVGPIVIEIPPADANGSLNANIVNVWQTPLEDAGLLGIDKGAGGKFVILPPGYKEHGPGGYDRAATRHLRQLHAAPLEPEKPQRRGCCQVDRLWQADESLSALAGSQSAARRCSPM